jgi:ubiquinone/menaquinone biosynthesis C-methylase UbiE
MIKQKKGEVEKYFRRYLRIGPLALALWRSVEAKHLSRVTLKHPILDIGCGFGEFAVAFADEQIDMGIDINSRDLYVAAKTKKYKNLTLADARDLPFTDNSYASIFSISTLEHIPDSDKVLKEAYRVLKPGGIIFLTLETDEVDDATFYRPLLKKIGLGKISNFASERYNALFHRQTLLPKNVWRKKMEKAGFKIEICNDIISHEVNRLFDIWLITAWPSMLLKPFIGKRVVFRPKFIEDLLTKRYLKYVAKEETEGTNLLIIARKI